MSKPQGWRDVRLGDVAEIAIGGTPSRGNPAYWDPERRTSNRWASIADIKGRYLSDTSEYISDLGVENSSVKRVPPGTVLMSFKLTIGRAAMARAPLFTNEAIAAFFPGADVSPEYLYYALPRAALEVEPDEAVKGKTLNKAKLYALTLALPSLSEQRKIAAILSSVDDTIERTQAVIDQLHATRKAMLQELLTRGIPGRHTRRKKTETGEVPEGWELVLLGSLLSRGPYNGLYKPQGEYGAGVPIVRIDAFANGERITGAGLRRVRATREEAERFGLHPDDILVNRVNSLSHLGKVALVGALGEPTVFESNMMQLSVDARRIMPEFAFLILSAPITKAFFLNRAKQAVAQASINQEDVQAAPIPLPPLAEQRQIVEACACLDARQKVEQKALEALTGLKSALLSVLLTGEVRVTPDDTAASPSRSG